MIAFAGLRLYERTFGHFMTLLNTFQHGLLHIGALWRSTTEREYDENETTPTCSRIFIAVFLLLEDFYKKSRLVIKGDFIKVSNRVTVAY